MPFLLRNNRCSLSACARNSFLFTAAAVDEEFLVDSIVSISCVQSSEARNDSGTRQTGRLVDVRQRLQPLQVPIRQVLFYLARNFCQ